MNILRTWNYVIYIQYLNF